ncbi:nuclear pore complex protein -like isoform X1 [Biomphalaria glabrata]|nr:nuclear pore complex protein [Biomphalaria glabrata]
MWKSWNPFKRKQKEDNDTNNGQSGKENVNGLNIIEDNLDTGKVRVLDNDKNPNFQNEHQHARSRYDDLDGRSHESQNYNGIGLNQNSSVPNKLQVQENDLNLLRSPLRLSSKNRSAAGLSKQHNESNDTLNNGTFSKSSEECNKSFSGIHGPLLSCSPIVPQVRRTIEENMGLRSPQSSKSQTGKQVARSLSLKYSSPNPTKSTAGQLPWVRLKRRGSIGLNDLVSGNIPLSPNTVKLATPELRHLPSAPSFKSTPLIVTTEASRPCVVDTQTVVSALREKRKRFGQTQHEETLSEDSWQSSAKRRRQDSSQSNASSVSMPPMPETLPNLIGTPSSSLLHIENLSDQRPSTVPAIDAFISHHQRIIGLGGPGASVQPQQFYPSQQPQPASRNVNNSKTVYMSIQSSLSSSQRLMSNLSALQQHGIDHKRLRGLSQSSDSPRKALFTSDQSICANSSSDSRPASTNQGTITTTASSTSTTQTVTNSDSITVSAADTQFSTASREIAQGVVLRRRDLTITPTAQSVPPLKTSHGNLLVSASDFEMDRKREYKRRVLDLLGAEENEEEKDVTSLNSVLPTLPNFSQASAATSVSISASLDSLNKLGQSTTLVQPSQPSSSTANSLSELLKSNEDTSTSQPSVAISNPGSGLSLTGNPVQNPSSAQPLTNNPLQSSSALPVTVGGFNFTTGTPANSSSNPGGFSFGLQTNTADKPKDKPAPASSAGFTFGVSTSVPSSTTGSSIATTTGFNFAAPPATAAPLTGINFGTSISPAGTSALSVISAQESKGITTAPAQVPFNFQTQPVSSTSQGFSTSTSSGSAAGLNQTNTSALKMPGYDINPTSSQTPVSSQQSTVSKVSGIGGFTFGAIGNTSQPSATVFGSLGTVAASAANSEIKTSAVPVASSQSAFNPSSITFGTLPNLTTTTAPVNFGQSVSTSGLGSLSSGQAIGSSPFTFGASAGNSASTFGQTTTTTASTASPFTLGQTAPASSSTTPTFNFGTTNIAAGSGTSSIGFGQTATSSSTPFSFGQPPATTSSSSSASLGFGQATTASGLSISFGQTPPTNVSTTSFNFGQTASTNVSTAPFSFGQGAPVTSTNAAPFGQSTTTTAAPSFNFGQVGSSTTVASLNFSQQATSTQATGASPFGFGSMAPTSTTSTINFGQASNPSISSTAPFGFGQGAAVTTANSSFTFGQAAKTSATTPFSLGASSTQPSASVFGSTPVASTAGSSVFGSTNTLAPASSSVFGSVNQGFSNTTNFGNSIGFGNAPSSFGGSGTQSLNPVVSSTPFGFSAASTAAPVFGSNITPANTFGTSSTGSSIFGTSAANKPFSFSATPASTSSTPLFGSATTTVSFGATAPGISIFGAKPAASGAVFGATTTTTASSTFGSITSSGFGGTAAQPPSFGGSGSTFGNAQQSSIFGQSGLNQPPAFGAPSSGFGTTNPPAVFGAPATQPSFNFTGQSQPANSFGNQTSSISTGGFNFSQPPAQPANSSGFNFSAQTSARPSFPTPTPGSFNFSAMPSPGAFNFNTAPATPQMPSRPRVAARRPTRRGGARR